MLKYIHGLFTAEELNAFDEGMLTIILDAMDFIPVLFLACFLFHHIGIGLLYILELSLLRQYSGGWHAGTLIKCIFSYVLTYLVFEALLSCQIKSVCLHMVNILCVLYMLKYSPMIIPYSYDQSIQKQNRKRSLLVFITAFILSIAVDYLNPLYGNAMSLTLIINTCLMLLQQIQNHRKGEINGTQNNDH